MARSSAPSTDLQSEGSVVVVGVACPVLHQFAQVAGADVAETGVQRQLSVLLRLQASCQ